MPVPHNKVLIGFSNTSGKPSSLSIAVSSAAPVSSAALLVSWATGIAAYITASLPAPLALLMSAGTKIDRVKCMYNHGPLQIAAGEAPLTTAKPGTGTNIQPAQVACVFSLITGLTGKSYRGRVYWPATGAALDANGHFTAALSGLAGAFDTLIKTGIMGAAQAPPSAVGAVHSVTKDVLTPLTAIRVGSGPDTQRRRKTRAELTGQVVY